MCEFVKEFFINFIYEFMCKIYTDGVNLYEFVQASCTKNWLCYKWPLLYSKKHLTTGNCVGVLPRNCTVTETDNKGMIRQGLVKWNRVIPQSQYQRGDSPVPNKVWH